MHGKKEHAVIETSIHHQTAPKKGGTEVCSLHGIS